MKEGYYWILDDGNVQIAYYSDGETEDLETGQLIRGVWHLTQGDDICHDGEAEVLAGPLTPPYETDRSRSGCCQAAFPFLTR